MRLIIGDIYQGREAYAKNTYGKDITVYKNLAEDIKNSLQEGLSEEKIIENILLRVNPYNVVIAEEGYCGLTPIKKEERTFTEIYGRTLGAISRNADSVERVVCGLAISLK